MLLKKQRSNTAFIKILATIVGIGLFVAIIAFRSNVFICIRRVRFETITKR